MSNGPVNLFSPENVPPFYSKAARVAFEKLEKGNVGDRSLPVLKNIGGLKKLLKS